MYSIYDRPADRMAINLNITGLVSLASMRVFISFICSLIDCRADSIRVHLFGKLLLDVLCILRVLCIYIKKYRYV